MLPELFKDMFIKVTDVHDHDTRNATTDQLYIRIYGTVRGQKSFKYGGVRTCNYILQNVITSFHVCFYDTHVEPGVYMVMNLGDEIESHIDVNGFVDVWTLSCSCMSNTPLFKFSKNDVILLSFCTFICFCTLKYEMFSIV